MSLWEVSEALGGGASAAAGGSASMDAVLAGRPSAAEPPRSRSARSRRGLGDSLAHLNLRGRSATAPGAARGRDLAALVLGAIDGPPLLEEEEQSSEEAEAQAEEEALALLQALVDEEEMPNAARSSPAFAALAAPAAPSTSTSSGSVWTRRSFCGCWRRGGRSGDGVPGRGLPGGGLSLGVEPSYDDWRPPPACAVGALPTGAELIPMTSSPRSTRRPRPGATACPPRPSPCRCGSAGRRGRRAFGAFDDRRRARARGGVGLTPAVVAGVSGDGDGDGERAQRLGAQEERGGGRRDPNGVALRLEVAQDRGDAPRPLRRRRPQPVEPAEERGRRRRRRRGEVSAPPPPKPAAPRKPKAEKEEGGGAKPSA